MEPTQPPMQPTDPTPTQAFQPVERKKVRTRTKVAILLMTAPTALLIVTFVAFAIFNWVSATTTPTTTTSDINTTSSKTSTTETFTSDEDAYLQEEAEQQGVTLKSVNLDGTPKTSTDTDSNSVTTTNSDSDSNSTDATTANSLQSSGELFAKQDTSHIVTNIILFILGVIGTITWLPGLIIGIVLLATAKK